MADLEKISDTVKAITAAASDDRTLANVRPQLKSSLLTLRQLFAAYVVEGVIGCSANAEPKVIVQRTVEITDLMVAAFMDHEEVANQTNT